MQGLFHYCFKFNIFNFCLFCSFLPIPGRLGPGAQLSSFSRRTTGPRTFGPDCPRPNCQRRTIGARDPTVQDSICLEPLMDTQACCKILLFWSFFAWPALTFAKLLQMFLYFVLHDTFWWTFTFGGIKIVKNSSTSISSFMFLSFVFDPDI